MRIVHDWASRRLRTKSTRKTYIYAIRLFLETFGVSSEEALKWKVEYAEDRIQDFQDMRVKAEKTGSTVKVEMAALKRFFRDHRIRVIVSTRDILVKKSYLDYFPSRDVVQMVLDGLKLHYKAGAALIAFSGLRPIDATELQFKNLKVSYKNGDKILTILKEHRKTQSWYVSFIGTQGTRYIRLLLDSRQINGEEITDETHIVSKNGKQLSPSALSSAIKRVIVRTAGYNPTGESFRRFRTYGLRKYFRRAVDGLGDAESEYLMGHKKGLMSLEATYNGLRDLDPQAVIALKKKYISILPELETEITDVTLRAQLQDKEKEKKALVDDLSEIREELDEIKEFIQKRREMDR